MHVPSMDTATRESRRLCATAVRTSDSVLVPTTPASGANSKSATRNLRSLEAASWDSSRARFAVELSRDSPTTASAVPWPPPSMLMMSHGAMAVMLISQTASHAITTEAVCSSTPTRCGIKALKCWLSMKEF